MKANNSELFNLDSISGEELDNILADLHTTTADLESIQTRSSSLDAYWSGMDLVDLKELADSIRSPSPFSYSPTAHAQKNADLCTSSPNSSPTTMSSLSPTSICHVSEISIPPYCNSPPQLSTHIKKLKKTIDIQTHDTSVLMADNRCKSNEIKLCLDLNKNLGTILLCDPRHNTPIHALLDETKLGTENLDITPRDHDEFVEDMANNEFDDTVATMMLLNDLQTLLQSSGKPSASHTTLFSQYKRKWSHSTNSLLLEEEPSDFALNSLV